MAEPRAPRALWVVCGSRVFANDKHNREWVRVELYQDLHGRVFPAASGAPVTVVTCDAIGPDVEAQAVAREYKRPLVVYGKDGYRYVGGVRKSRWSESWPPAVRDRDRWREWLLAKDAAMAADVGRLVARGERAFGLAIVAGWSETRGTEYTAGKLSAAGVDVKVVRKETRDG